MPRAALDYLTGQVGTISEAAQRAVLALLEQVDWSNVTDAARAVAEAVAAVCDAAAQASAQAGAEFYDELRAAQAGSAMGAVPRSGFDQAACEGAVRAAVRFAVSGEMDKLARALAGRADYEARRAANVSVAENARADPLRPRFARVPTGAETCGFCWMLASFGFHYSTADAASHAHANCDCRVVPQFSGEGVEGYDPDGMYRRYEDVLGALGGRDGVRAAWDALPAEERERRIERAGGKSGEAFEKFLRSRVAAEAERRDPKWLYEGKVPEVGYADEEARAFKLKARKTDRKSFDLEMASAKRLAERGYRVVFQIDERRNTGPDANGRPIIGYADLVGGIEIKNCLAATSANTLQSHVSSFKKKIGATCLFFDFSGNSYLEDDEARVLVEGALASKLVDKALVLFANGNLVYVAKRRHDGDELKEIARRARERKRHDK